MASDKDNGHEPIESDHRYALLKELGERERQMAHDLGDVRAEIARLVTQLLPMHAPRGRIEPVVQASGYSRAFVEFIRTGKSPWLR